MNIRHSAIAVVSSLMVTTGIAVAQPTPVPSPSASTPVSASTPALSTQQREEIEKIVDDRFEKSARVGDRIQTTVNSNFGWAIGLLTALIAGLGVMPIIIVVLVWLLRGSVIQQIVSETKKQLEQDIGQAVKDQLDATVTVELSRQIEAFKQELENSKLEFINQLQILFLAAQQEKDKIFQELSKITPSVIQEEFVSPEVQQKIQELTRQLELLKAANAQLSLTADDYIQQGDALYFENRYDEANASYDKALQIEPNLFSAWVSKGKALRKAGRYEEALIANEKAIQLKSDNYWSWFGRGYTLTDLKRYDEALSSFEKSTDINPAKHYAWKHRGYILTKLGQYAEAIASLEKALELRSTSSGTYYWKAYCHLVQNQAEAAIESLKQAIYLDIKHREVVKSDPDFDALRNDPRFKQLIEADSQVLVQ